MIRNFLKSGAIAMASLSLLCACSSDDEENEAPQPSSDAILGVSEDIENTAITYCYQRYYSDAETRTTAEIFSGDEMAYGHLIMRTHPQKRAGMYFLMMFGWEPDSIAIGCTIELSVDTTDNPHPRTFVFTVPETHSVFREVKLGITGKDWPDAKAKVNAWKIVVKSPSGAVITQKQSWLWGLDKKDAAK